MATWIHLSRYLILAIDLSSFKLFNAASAVFRTAPIKKKKTEKRKTNGFNFTYQKHQNLTFFHHQYDVTKLLGR